jgi:hypothetical protein
VGATKRQEQLKEGLVAFSYPVTVESVARVKVGGLQPLLAVWKARQYAPLAKPPRDPKMSYGPENYLFCRRLNYLTRARSVSIMGNNWGAGAGPNNNAAS